MKNIKPCPYCGGEVELIALRKNEKEKKDKSPQPYRIECQQCKALVARGQGFPIETLSDAEDRIREYKKCLKQKFAPSGWGHKWVGTHPQY